MTIKRQIVNIVVHCSASPQGRGDDASDIHRWHREKGWDGIGYHYVILEDGMGQVGRPLYWVGAHVANYNDTSIGICLIGEGGDATEAQLGMLESLITGLLVDYPDANPMGHCDLDPVHKAHCPGFNVADWYANCG